MLAIRTGRQGHQPAQRWVGLLPLAACNTTLCRSLAYILQLLSLPSVRTVHLSMATGQALYHTMPAPR